VLETCDIIQPADGNDSKYVSTCLKCYLPLPRISSKGEDSPCWLGTNGHLSMTISEIQILIKEAIWIEPTLCWEMSICSSICIILFLVCFPGYLVVRFFVLIITSKANVLIYRMQGFIFFYSKSFIFLCHLNIVG